MRFIVGTQLDNGLCPDCGAAAIYSYEGIGYCKTHHEQRVHGWQQDISKPNVTWQETALAHARSWTYSESRSDDCCGNCVSMKEKGEVYVEDHCKDMRSAFPNEHVERGWWCVRHERRAH